MNYIGSKYSLLPQIAARLEANGVRGRTFLDVFSGTTVVAQLAKGLGYEVTSNDLQAYSYVQQRALVACPGYPDFAAIARDLPPDPAPRPGFGLGPEPGPDADPLRRVLAHLETLAPAEGPFTDLYCEGGGAGRNYFSAENGRRCQAIRDQLEAWRTGGAVTDDEFHLLLASLLETLDGLANTASVYGAYLKHVKRSAAQPLRLRLPRLTLAAGRHRAFQEDGAALVRRLAREGEIDVLYVDPPYNRRQYAANYHLLETVARWDVGAFEPQGKTGLRPAGAQRSRFCLGREVHAAFEELLESARVRHVLVSYSNEGLLSEAELREILTERANGGRTDFHKLPYRRFRADVDSEVRAYKGDAVQEFLFYAELKPRRRTRKSA